MPTDQPTDDLAQTRPSTPREPGAGYDQKGGAVDGTTDPAADPGATYAGGGAPGPATAHGPVPGYEILTELGRGGMGVVYKARHLALGRTVALKVVRAGDAASARDLARFRAEAATMARIRHPHVAEVYEAGELDGRPFFTLEYCPGGSLVERLTGTPWPPAAAARVVEALARGVAAAHAQGVVHRDLKPGNVLLTGPLDTEELLPVGLTVTAATWHALPPLPVKVTDFGLAKLADETAHTSTGAVMGTPAYMAPEQARGEGRDAGPAADVYALGVILYELLTGAVPFRGSTVMDTLRQVLDRSPLPPRRAVGGVPPALDAICLKCLEKDPRHRYASAAGLADDLTQFLTGAAVSARRAGQWRRAWRWCTRNPAVAGLLAAVALSLVLGSATATLFAVRAAAHAERADREAERAGERAEAAERAQSEAAAARTRAEAELGRAEDLLYTAGLDAAAREWTNRNAGEALAALHATRWDLRGWEFDLLASRFERGQTVLAGVPVRSARVFALRPDGREVASVGPDGLALFDTATGRPARVMPDVPEAVGRLAYDPAGTVLAVAAGDGVQLHDAKTGKLVRKLPHPTGGNLRGAESLSWSPRGDWVIASTRAEVVAWTADGQRAHRFDTGKLSCLRADLDPTGTRLAVSGRLDTVDRTEVREFPGGKPLWAAPGWQAAFSPDGARVAVAVGPELRLLDARDGTTRATGIGHLRGVMDVAYRPGGRHVLTCGHDGTLRLWDAESGAPVRAWHGHVGSVYRAMWAADARHFVSCGGDGTARRWAADRDQGPLELPVADGVVRAVALSPDGRRVAAATDRTLRVWDAADGRLAAESPAGRGDFRALAFTPDGSHLVASEGTSNSDGPATGVRIALRDAGTLAPVREFVTPGLAGSLAVSSDGTFLAAARSAHAGEPQDAVGLWDLKTGRLIRTLAASHRSGPLHFNTDGTRVAVGGENVAVWDARTGQLIAELPEGACGDAAFSPDGGRIATSSGGVYDAATGRPLVALQSATGRYGAVAFSADGRRVIMDHPSHRVVVYNASTGRVVFEAPSGEGGLDKLTVTPDGRRAAGVDAGREAVMVLDARPAEVAVLVTSERARPDEQAGDGDRGMTAVATSPDGRWIAAGGQDGRPQVWDTRTGRPTAAGPVHSGGVRCVAFAPDGTSVASVGHDRTVRLWHPESGVESKALAGHRGSAAVVRWSADGRTLVSAGGVWDEQKEQDVAGEVIVWDARTGEQLRRWEGHPADVTDLAVSPDGRAASVAGDGRVRVWDVATGRRLAEWAAHDGSADSVAFSPTGHRVVTGGADGAAVWDPVGGTKVCDLNGHDGPVWAVAFAPDGARVITGGRDGAVAEWQADTGRRLAVRPGHTRGVMAVAASARFTTSASDDGTVRVWRPTSE